MNAAALVFDLDGTLVDSRRDLAAAVNLTRAELGLSPLPAAVVGGMVGEGARVLLERALGPSLHGERFDAALATFLAHYDQVCLQTTTLYAGLEPVLVDLATRFPMGLLTNKPARMTAKLLTHLGVAGCFAHVLAGDTAPRRKPDPAGIRWMAERFGVQPRSLALVGDSEIDGRTAIGAGCRLVLVEWGFSSAWSDEVRAHAAAVVGEPSRLLELFAAG